MENLDKQVATHFNNMPVKNVMFTGFWLSSVIIDLCGGHPMFALLGILFMGYNLIQKK